MIFQHGYHEFARHLDRGENVMRAHDARNLHAAMPSFHGP
jgi:hypothetical protein